MSATESIYERALRFAARADAAGHYDKAELYAAIADAIGGMQNPSEDAIRTALRKFLD